MPLGPFGEVVGTTNTLEALGPDAANYKSKVIAPRNPKLLKGDEEENKVLISYLNEKHPLTVIDSGQQAHF